MTLAKIEDWKVLAAADPAAMRKRIADNIGGNLSIGDLLRLKVPGSGGQTWETVDALTGEVMPERTVTGIVVLWQMQRAYWSKPYGEQGEASNLPECVSVDALTGVGAPGGDCTNCPLAKFGTAVNKDGSQGAGQACTQMMTVFFVRPKSLLPMLLRVPPSSLQNMRRFFVGLTEADLHYRNVVIEFGLEKVKNEGGLEYSRIRPRVAGRVPAEKFDVVEAYGEQMRPLLVQTARND